MNIRWPLLLSMGLLFGMVVVMRSSGQNPPVDPAGLASAAPLSTRAQVVADRLGLSPEQVKRLDALQSKYQSLSAETHSLMEKMRNGMARELRDPNPDFNGIREKHQALKALACRLMDFHFDELIQIREILTPEQNRLLIELAAQEPDVPLGR